MNDGQTDTIDMDYEDESQVQTQRLEKLDAIVSSMQSLADDQVSKKAQIERRWLEDLTQFHGRYPTDIESNLTAAGKSKLFVNYTRNKTNSWEARLSDMLFPTDDKNWGIGPSPSPELSRSIKDGNQESMNLRTETLKRAAAMETEIQDQLVQCRYGVKMRDVIHDACKLGTGISKGPTASTKNVRKWAPAVGSPGQFELRHVPDARPDHDRVDPWNYFPDMNARAKHEAEFEFERHLLNKQGMRRLAKMPGFDQDAVRAVMDLGPSEGMPTYIQQVKAIVDEGESLENRFHVWEYHGSLDGQDLRLVYEMMGQEDHIEDIGEDDSLAEIRVIMWFCNGKVLKIGAHPLDSGESLYSVFNLEKDDSSIFGFGCPYMMRDSQKSINGAWRMIMDNSALSTGPQVVINKKIITPADGSWNLTPRKIWYATLKNGQGLDHAFKTYGIDGHQEELIQVIALAKQFADDETNLPLVASGESGSHQTQTSGGMSMLMNSVNVVFRRVVKNFDDDMTTPNIRRSYDFNMQFSKKDEIKGDFEIEARGSSVLLVREIQAQNLMSIAMNFANHPIFGKITKPAALYRSLVKANMLPADSIIMTDDEIAVAEAKAAETPPPPDPELLKLESKERIVQMQGDIDIAVANLARDTAMVSLAEKKNMQIEEIRARFGIVESTNQSKERLAGAEMAFKKKTGGDGI